MASQRSAFSTARSEASVPPYFSALALRLARLRRRYVAGSCPVRRVFGRRVAVPDSRGCRLSRSIADGFVTVTPAMRLPPACGVRGVFSGRNRSTLPSRAPPTVRVGMRATRNGLRCPPPVPGVFCRVGDPVASDSTTEGAGPGGEVVALPALPAQSGDSGFWWLVVIVAAAATTWLFLVWRLRRDD